MTGKILYKSSLNKFKLEYSSGQVEWFDPATKSRIRRCTTQCVTIPFFEAIPHFFLKTGDTASNDIIIEQKTCKVYNRAQSSAEPLQWLAVDPANSNTICAALLRNGIQFTFLNLDSTPEFTDSALSHNCQLNIEGCNSKLDIYFIGDESGSVTQNGFNAEINFMRNMIQDNLDIGDNKVQAGLTFFADNAELVQELTGNKSRLLSRINSETWGQGKTCISCGLDMASLNFEGNKSRDGVPKLYVVVTDGKNNMPEPQPEADRQLLEAAARAKGIVAANGGAVVAVGVGTDYNSTELRRIISKEKFLLQILGFDDLKGITNDIISSACEESDYICDSCVSGFCLCGKCVGCPGGCPGELQTGEGIGGNTEDSPVGLIVGLIIAGVAVAAGAIAGIIFFLKKKDATKNGTTTDGKTRTGTVTEEEKRETIDIPERSGRFSGLVRKYSEPPIPETLKRDTKE